MSYFRKKHFVSRDMPVHTTASFIWKYEWLESAWEKRKYGKAGYYCLHRDNNSSLQRGLGLYYLLLSGQYNSRPTFNIFQDSKFSSLFVKCINEHFIINHTFGGIFKLEISNHFSFDMQHNLIYLKFLNIFAQTTYYKAKAFKTHVYQFNVTAQLSALHTQLGPILCYIIHAEVA